MFHMQYAYIRVFTAVSSSLLSSRITLPRGFFFTSFIGIMKAFLTYMLKQ